MLKWITITILAVVLLSCSLTAWCCCAMAGKADEAAERL